MPNDPQTPATATTPEPTVSTTPLSVSTFGRLNIIIFRQTEGDKSGIFLNIRSASGGDPTAIPLADVPALVMMLKEIAAPAISVRTFTPTVAAPEPPASALKRSKKK